MIKKINILLIMLFTLAFVSCKDETFTHLDIDPNLETDAIGYLSLSSLTLDVIDQSEAFEDDQNNSATSKAASKSDSTPELLIKVTNTISNECVLEFKSSELDTMQTEIALTPSTYIISAEVDGQGDGLGWEEPTYFGQTGFTIVKNITTTVTDLNCTLSNIQVSLTLSVDLKDMFKYEAGSDDNIKTTISLGEDSFVFELDETRSAFFIPYNLVNELEVSLHGYFNNATGDVAADYIETTWTATISDVMAGQWRAINIYLDHAYDGNVNFEMSVENWVYEKDLVVDITAMLATSYFEEIIPEYDFGVSMENSPTFTVDQAEEDKITISTENYDADLDVWYSSVSASASPVSGSTIESIKLMFTTDNSALNSALAQYEDNTFEIFNTNTYPEYFFVKEDGSDVSIKLYPSAMSEICKYSGEHTVMVICEDSEERISYTEYALEVISTAGPEVIWQDSLGVEMDFDTRYLISTTSYPDVIVNIKSNSGITGFKVLIDSDALSSEVLSGLYLDTEMDLISPATDKMEENLRGLGFPTGDMVEGQTELPLDITEFMPALAILGTSGDETNFTFKVTDNSGTTTRVIKLKAE